MSPVENPPPSGWRLPYSYAWSRGSSRCISLNRSFFLMPVILYQRLHTVEEYTLLGTTKGMFRLSRPNLNRYPIHGSGTRKRSHPEDCHASSPPTIVGDAPLKRWGRKLNPSVMELFQSFRRPMTDDRLQ